MHEDKENDTEQDSITVQRGVAQRFRSYKRRMGFPTNSDFLDALLRMVSARNLSRYDIYAYGKPLEARTKDENEPYIPSSMPKPEDFKR